MTTYTFDMSDPLVRQLLTDVSEIKTEVKKNTQLFNDRFQRMNHRLAKIEENQNDLIEYVDLRITDLETKVDARFVKIERRLQII